MKYAKYNVVYVEFNSYQVKVNFALTKLSLLLLFSMVNKHPLIAHPSNSTLTSLCCKM